MPQAQFYLIQEAVPENDELSLVENKACDLATSYFRAGKKVLLWCENKEQAERLDDALWQRDGNAFVPHNLAGEITKIPTPVELAWAGKRNSQRRDVIINLSVQVPEFINSFNHAIDFVPLDEAKKVLARERYKYYRQLGWQLKMEQ